MSSSQSISSVVEEPSAQDQGQGPRVERISHEAHLRPGLYWRAKREVEMPAPDGVAHAYTFGRGRSRSNWISYTAEKGETLLVVEVRKDGDEDHTVVMAPHPKSNQIDERIRIGVWEFLEAFEPVNGEEIRAKEMAGIQQDINNVQADINRAASDPAYLQRVTLKALADQSKKSKGTAVARPEDVRLDILHAEPPTLSEALASAGGNLVFQTMELVESTQKIAEAQGRWFAKRADDLKDEIQRLMPYHLEKAQVALASSSTHVARAHSLLEGVTTMKLFTGSEVEVEVLLDGEPAPAGTAITLLQQKLWADEEMAYLHRYVDRSVDEDMMGHFVEVLRKDKRLVEQMMPYPRSVVLMGASRQRSLAEHPFVAAMIERTNAKSLLLIRDGGRLLLVASSADSHEMANQLFPEQDVDGSIFGGVDGASITPEDLRWTDRLDDLHKMAVHYRRFAVVLAGVISRGEAYKEVDFQALFTGAGNDQVLRYVRDATGEGVIGQVRETVDEYFERMNRGLLHGMRVAVRWDKALSPTSAPRAYDSLRSGGYSRRVWTDQKCGIVPVQETKTSLQVTCTEGVHSHDRRFSGKLDVTLQERGRWLVPGNSFLCIERVDADELDELMRVRRFRGSYPQYIDLFGRVRDEARATALAERPVREALKGALLAGNVASAVEAEQLAGETLLAFRANPVLDPQSPRFQELCDHAWRLSNKNKVSVEAVEQLARDAGVEPLRLVVEASGRVVLYADPKVRDDRALPQEEVDAYQVNLGVRRSRLALLGNRALHPFVTGESALHEWPAAAGRIIDRAPLLALSRKARMIEDFETHFEDRRSRMFGPMSQLQGEEALEDLKAQYRKVRNTGSWHSKPAPLALPVGLVATKKVVWVLMVHTGESYLHSALRNAPPAIAQQLLAEYQSRFQNPGAADRSRSAAAVMRKDAKPVELQIHAVPSAEWKLGNRSQDRSQAQALYYVSPEKAFGGFYRQAGNFTDAPLALTSRTLHSTKGRWDDKLTEDVGYGYLDSERIQSLWLHPALDLSSGKAFEASFYKTWRSE